MGSAIMQSLTFIKIMVSEKIAILTILCYTGQIITDSLLLREPKNKKGKQRASFAEDSVYTTLP